VYSYNWEVPLDVEQIRAASSAIPDSLAGQPPSAHSHVANFVMQRWHRAMLGPVGPLAATIQDITTRASNLPMTERYRLVANLMQHMHRDMVRTPPGNAAQAVDIAIMASSVLHAWQQLESVRLKRL
jgi:hypothetical protein